MRKSGSYETSKNMLPKSPKSQSGMCPEGPEGSKIGSVLFPARHGTEKSGTDRVGSGPARTGTEHPCIFLGGPMGPIHPVWANGPGWGAVAVICRKYCVLLHVLFQLLCQVPDIQS